MKKIISNKSDTDRDNAVRTISTWNKAFPPHIDDLFHVPIGFFELLDSVAIGVVILDLNRKIVAMNQTLKALTGFSHKELSGLTCAHILRSNVCLHNCPALIIREESGPHCIEGNLINKDRQLIPIRITSAPLQNIEGKMVGFLETVEDIRLLRKLDETTSHAYNFNNIIGRSPEMEKVQVLVENIKYKGQEKYVPKKLQKFMDAINTE